MPATTSVGFPAVGVSRIATKRLKLMAGAVIVAAALATVIVSVGGSSLNTAVLRAPQGVRIAVIARSIPLPTSFAFAPGGRVFVGAADKDRGGPRGGVYLLGPNQSSRRVVSVPTGAAATWSAGRLFVATSGHVDVYSAFNGRAFARRSTVLTGLPTWVNGVAAGPDGRIWVTIGGDCDNCVASAKLAQMVISVAPEGGDEPRIVARRLRQPYGIAFPPGSSVPLVTVVGQDDLGSNPPPDAIVRAAPGSDFGFPTCNWATGSSCASFTKPFTLLEPHTTPTGIAVIGATAYIGTYGSQAILRMPLTGSSSKPKPFVTGFSSAVIAVGAHRGRLYVGTLSGTIYRIDP